jgi:hypothetical protein
VVSGDCLELSICECLEFERTEDGGRRTDGGGGGMCNPIKRFKESLNNEI